MHRPAAVSLVLVAAGCAFVAYARPALAQRSVRRHPHRVVLAADVPALAVSAAWWGTSQLVLNRIVTPSCPCNAADVIPIDRWVALDGGM